VWDFFTHEYYYGSRNLPLPVFAAGETHDTPRLAAREGGRTLARMLTLLNMFMPNGVPFINSGQEVWEIQPMNTGLDCRENEAFLLPPDDPYYGKLALFDKVEFHYLNEGRWDLINQLSQVAAIRQAYLDTLTNPDCFVGLGFASMRTHGIGLGYVVQERRADRSGNLLLVIANTHLHEGQSLFVDIAAIRRQSGNQSHRGNQIFSSFEAPRDGIEFSTDGNLFIWMQPGEVKIIAL
jgi:starch synthase (maltosyl-transferring)